MFIIVEGPDGAGKSTFVQDLAMQLWREGRGTVLINPKRSPNQPPLVEYKGRLDFYRPRIGLDLILDRCWYSDDVYGPRWRAVGLAPGVQDELDAWADSLGAIVAYLDQPDEVLRARLSVRGDDDVDPEDVAYYAGEYRRLYRTWGLPVLCNPSIQDTIKLAQEREEKAKHVRPSSFR